MGVRRSGKGREEQLGGLRRALEASGKLVQAVEALVVGLHTALALEVTGSRPPFMVVLVASQGRAPEGQLVGEEVEWMQTGGRGTLLLL